MQTGIISNVYYVVTFVILLCIFGYASIRIRRNRLNIFYSLRYKKVWKVEWVGIKKVRKQNLKLKIWRILEISENLSHIKNYYCYIMAIFVPYNFHKQSFSVLLKRTEIFKVIKVIAPPCITILVHIISYYT